MLSPVVAAGVAEVEVGISAIDSLTIKLLPCARITVGFSQRARSARSGAIRRRDAPMERIAHLRKGLAATTNWRADGTFGIDGLLGRHRLTVRSSGNWFTVSATLENGTDIANGPIDFEPGRTYGGVRVRLSDETAEIEGLMPEGWNASSHSMVIVFPEDGSLWQDNRRYIQTGNVAPLTRRFSVKRLPPGHVYLVAFPPSRPTHSRAGSTEFPEPERTCLGTRFQGEAGNSRSRCGAGATRSLPRTLRCGVRVL